jgi:hypothetical protein
LGTSPGFTRHFDEDCCPAKLKAKALQRSRINI